MNEVLFVWQENVREILWTVFLSMVPMFEGRYALLTFWESNMPLPYAYILAFVASTIPMFLIMLLVKPLLRLMHKTGVRFLSQFANFIELRELRGAEKVSRRGLLGLFLFVAIPLPVTGVWTGTLISVLLGYDRPRSMACIAAGNAVACLITLLIKMIGHTL